MLSECAQLYRHHFWLFATMALAIVIPVDLLAYAFDGLTAPLDFSTDVSTAGQIAGSLSLILIPLISAGHTVAVMELGEGRVPKALEALRSTLPRLLALVFAVFLWTVGSGLALLLIILPGIYLYVRWYVCVQAVIVEGKAGDESLTRSTQLVRGNWWHVFRISTVLYVISLIPLWGLSIGLEHVADELGAQVIFLAGRIVGDAASLSFTALGSTLIYFDLRAREREAAPATP